MQVWRGRQESLLESYDLFNFTRLQRQIEITQSQNEHFLSGSFKADDLDQLESIIKNFQSKLITMKLDQEKASQLLDYAEKLSQKHNFPKDKITLKALNLTRKGLENIKLAEKKLSELQGQQNVQQFLQICQEFQLWLEEKQVLVEEDTYRSSRTLHGKWTRHQSVANEIKNNRKQLEDLQVWNLKIF